MPSRALARVLVTAAIVPLLGLAAPQHACACSCRMITEKEAYAGADAVFVGRVVRREEVRREVQSSGDPVILVFEVRIVHKGRVARRQDVHTVSSSASCGFEAQPGAEYLVFLDQSDGELHASACSGTRGADKPLAVPSAPSYPPVLGYADYDLEGDTWSPVRAAVGGAAVVAAVVAAFLLLRRRGRGGPERG
ncbi:hypothetical protein [Actinomadura craniellae]|nr:hypothetical protein [Actinomadura craniellae]